MENTQVQAVEPGHLYVVATPIGNLRDITLRALDVLREVTVIAAEDTRRSRQLLEYYEIRTPLVSYHEHNEETRSQELLQRLLAGESVAVISDAGTPLISDPGYRVVAEARKHGIPVVPIPGACAAVAALMASGLASHQFVFYGFVPRKQSEREKWWEELIGEKRTAIFYESPNRLIKTLTEMAKYFAQRQVVVARELTKVHEEFLVGNVEEVLGTLSQRSEIKGEIVILLAGAGQSADDVEEITDAELIDLLVGYMQTGIGNKEAVQQVVARTGAKKNRVYKLLLKLLDRGQ